jgi:hypothetical protein
MTEPTRDPKSAKPVAKGWLCLVANLPIEDPGARMRALRTLESLGAAVMRDGVFLLPETPANRQALEGLADYVRKNAGYAYVMLVTPLNGAQQETFRCLFDRSARYEELIRTIESLKIGYGVADPSAIARVLHKQRRELETIAALDYFPSASRERANAALLEAETAVRKLLFPEQAAAGMAADEPMLRRVWATRHPLWADRLACAWLIRRFIDPEATMVWLDKGRDCPPGALGFGFEGAHFGNSGSRVTYEEMLERLSLAKNPALAKIGSIVHYLEVRGTPVPEAAGVQTLLQGAAARCAGSDDQLLRETEKTFDLLFEAYEETANR